MSSTVQPGLLLLATRFPQMGMHSGYHLLAEAIPPQWRGPSEIIYRPYTSAFPRLTHKLIQPWLKRRPISPAYNYLGMLFERRAQALLKSGRFGIAHMLFVDNDYHLLADRARRGKAKLVGSVHKPSAWWRKDYPGKALLRTLDGVICMSTEQLDFFHEACPDSKIEFQRLGVDTSFYSPDPAANSTKLQGPPRFLCCGAHLRDFATLAGVVDLAAQRIPDLCFDVVAPEHYWKTTPLVRLAQHPRVRRHQAIGDEALRDLYRNALALVVPLHDTAANNAMSEAAACGLPVLVSDLQGARDYSTPEFAAYFAPQAVDAYVAAMDQLACNRTLVLERGRAARAFAEQNLDVQRLAAQAINFYLQILRS